MVRKINWMPLLLFGILSSMLLGCNEDVDKKYIEEYYFVNKCDYDIAIETLTKINSEYVKIVYELPKDSILFQEKDISLAGEAGIVALSDSLSVIFGNNKRISSYTYTESSFNLLNLNNYEHIKIEEYRFKNTYTFSNLDYENADEIQ